MYIPFSFVAIKIEIEMVSNNTAFVAAAALIAMLVALIAFYVWAMLWSVPKRSAAAAPAPPSLSSIESEQLPPPKYSAVRQQQQHQSAFKSVTAV